MTTVQQIKELYKVIKNNGEATTAKYIVGANANIYTNLGINLSGTTAVLNPYGVMIGQNSSAQDDHSIAIGKGTYAKGGCVAIGQYSTMTQSDDFKVVIGDGSANANHNCFTSDGSVITIDNNQVNIGNNASLVNIGNKESVGVNIGCANNSWVYLGYGTSSHTLIGEGNHSTVHIGNSGYTNVQIGEGAYNSVYLGSGVSSKTTIGAGSNSTVRIGDIENAQVSIGKGANSTVRIGNSFEGVNIWDASKVFLNSPVSDVYVPIEFDDCEVSTSSTSEFMAKIPLKINGSEYNLHNIPKNTRYKITVRLSADVDWDSQTRLPILSLEQLTSTQSQIIPKEASDKNDNIYSRSVFTTLRNMVYTHSNLYLYINPPTEVHTTYNYKITTTMYIPLKSLTLALMQDFS